jgi:type II secretory ATPase GspE/PulE/Tfp pilus assembly ATPase PilB-like protein
VVEEGEQSWFVMEHPSVLPQYDYHGRAMQRPALCRPSLFTQWFTGCESSSNELDESAGLMSVADEGSVQALHLFLKELVEGSHPSDWHLEPGEETWTSRIRMDGRLGPGMTITAGKGQWLLDSIIHQAGLGNHPPGKALDGSFTFSGTPGGRKIRIRVSLIPSMHGMALVLRFLYPDERYTSTLASLGLQPEQIRHIEVSLDKRHGLWLLAGPTGCGKSTTLHALLHLAVGRNEKVLAAEDPVETIIPGVQHVQTGHGEAFSFASMVRAFMRQSPDCILIGEIRDQETAAIALQAANSGHRILSSIHASTNAGILHRFADLGQPADQVASICDLVIHQRLIRLLCPHCASEKPVPGKYLDIISKLDRKMPEKLAVPTGCPNCREGYSGRTGIYSITRLDSPLQDGNPVLEAAWQVLTDTRTTLDCVLPFLPGALRSHFPLCQV